MARKRRQAGLSLVEILVALAIFVIGILAILRIFPRSLGLVTTVADRNDGIRLAEARLNDLRGEEGRLPDMILPAGAPTDVDPLSPTFGFLRIPAGWDATRPYDLDVPYTDGGDAPDALHRLLALDRLVVGERVLVGRSTGVYNGAVVANAAVYHTLFGPIERDGNGVPMAAAFRDFRRVQPLDLRVTQARDSSNNLFYRDRPVFAFQDGGLDDFTGAPAADKLLFEPDADDRLFVVRLAYRDGYGRIRWATLPAVAVAATPAPSPNPVVEVPLTEPYPPNAALTQVQPESIEVRQVLVREDGNSQFDRFEYDDAGYSHGILRFAPALAAETVSLEYVVDDWRNLREVITLQATGGQIDANGGDVKGGMIQLSTPFLDPGFVPRIVVASTGEAIPVDTTQWDEGNSRSGSVPLAAGQPVTSVQDGEFDAVIWYRRLGNWAVVPAIAPLRYLLASEAAAQTSSSDPDDYPAQNLVVEPATATVGASTYTELWFRPSEAGKTVAVSYRVGDPASPQLVTGELQVVPPQANRAGPGGLPRHAITLRRPEVVTDPGGELGIEAIEGKSLLIRAVYDDENRVDEGLPVRSTVDPNLSYMTAEQMVELSWYARRSR